MILESETTLTSEEYDNLLAQRYDATFRLKAYRWMPEYSEDEALVPEQDTHMFDMINHDDTLYAISYDLLKYLDGASWQDVTGYTVPDDRNTDIPYSLISQTELYVFAVSDTALLRNFYNGSTWDGWAEIMSDDLIVAAAATDKHTVHYVAYDETEHHYTLKTAHYTGIDWQSEESGIVWPFEITSFDAIHYNDKDVIVMSTHVPGAISAKYLNKQVVKYALDAGGIVAFTYKYDTWSDHIDVDPLDEIKEWRNRDKVRLSIVHDRLWLTCYSSDGTQRNSFDFYRSYQSIDGTHWSHGEYFPVPADNTSGVVLAELGTTTYAMFHNAIYAATSTLLFGNPHVDNIIDITRWVQDLSVTRQDMQQLSFTLNNETGWVQDSFLDGAQVTALILELGYWAGDVERFVQTAIFEVDALSNDEQLPEHVLSVSARDWMAWMTTKYQAEQFRFWMPQTIGGDDYSDNTGTGYGGMAHTAVSTGSWKTIDNQLRLGDNNTEGIVFSTYVTECWNGQFGIAVTPSQASNQEIYGLVFRAQDKDNGYFFTYEQEDDKYHLFKRAGGVVEEYWESTTQGKSASTSKFYMRIDFYYCTVRLYTSTDGISYSLLTEQVLPGLDPDAEIIQHGLVGLIGKGHSTETWNPPPPPIPPPLPNPPTDPILPWSGEMPAKGVVCSGVAPKVALATGYSLNTMTNVATITYSDRSGNLAALGVTYCTWGYSDPYNYRRFYLLTDIGILKNEDIDQSSTWVLMKTATELYGDPGYVGHQAMGSHMVNGWGLIMCGRSGVVVTTDGWQTITQAGVGFAGVPIYSPNTLNGGVGQVSVWLCGHDANHLFASVMTGDSGSPGGGQQMELYKSINGGTSWTFVSIATCDVFDVDSGRLNINRALVSVCIPYVKPSGATNSDNGSLFIELLILHTSSAGHWIGGQRIRSLDGGFNWLAVNTAAHPVVTRYGCSIAYFTHDSKYNHHATYDGSILHVLSTNNDSVTYTLSEPGEYAVIQGWINPNTLLAYDPGGGVDNKIWMSFDAGLTWYRGNMPIGWAASDGIAYAEFSLYTVQ